MQVFIEKWHPNIAIVNQRINSFDDDVFGHFRKILKNRTKQSTLDKFFKKTSAGESSVNVGESSGINQSPEVTLLDDVMEGDSSSDEK
uniref:Uncharacterized protein n=1 Tax=Arion vulgaris TaxID=1028688 RepID=A0A0B7BRR9_9EUPU